MKKIIIMFFLVCFNIFSEIILKSSLTEMTLNEKVKITVEFKGSSRGNYKIQGIENFEIISKNSVSKYVSTNFKNTSIKEDTYILYPIKEGISSLKIVQDGIESNIIEIDVNENKKLNSLESNKNSEENFYLKTNVNSKQYYFGEKFVYQEIFYALLQPQEFSYLSERELGDFSSIKLLEGDGRGNLKEEMVEYNGKKALKISLYNAILQSNSSGKKNIRSSKIRVTGRKRNIIGGDKIEIDILPLPIYTGEGKFSQIVGQLFLNKVYSDSVADVGKPITLTVKLSGKVNLENFTKFKIPDTPDFSVFQTLKSSKEEVRNNEIYSEKVFEIVFLPKKSGNLETPEISINYFNTKTGKYDFLIIPREKIEVKGNISFDKNNGKIDNIISSNQVNEAKELKKEIKIEKSTVEIITKDEKNNKKIFYGIVIGSAIILFQSILLIYLFFRKLSKKNKEKGSKISVNEKKLWKDLKKSKTDLEFYKNYSQYLIEKYNFNPKIHSELKLENLELRALHNRIESSMYKCENLEKDKIIEKLKEIIKK